MEVREIGRPHLRTVKRYGESPPNRSGILLVGRQKYYLLRRWPPVGTKEMGGWFAWNPSSGGGWPIGSHCHFRLTARELSADGNIPLNAKIKLARKTADAYVMEIDLFNLRIRRMASRSSLVDMRAAIVSGRKNIAIQKMTHKPSTASRVRHLNVEL